MKSTWYLAAATMLALVCAIPAWGSFIVGGDAGEVSPANPATWTTSTTGYVGLTSGKTGSLTVDGGSDLLSGSGYLGNVSGSTGTVTVAGVGSTWTTSGTFGFLYVGYSGTGSLRIESGGRVVSGAYGILGVTSGSTGTATVTGAGSTWTNNIYLCVGSSGTGTLTIESGGKVSSAYGILASESGSIGTATVTGEGSTWTSDRLNLGFYGTGTLTVQDGGTVNAETLCAATSDLKGNGTINVKGLVSDTNLVFDAAHGTNQAFPFGTGGILNLSVDGRGYLGAGYHGTASITVADGVKVSSTSGILGYNSGSSGTATVTGTGSTWTNSRDLYVGLYGGSTGTLTVENGGLVSSASGYVGDSSGSTGTATVNGAGSTWTNSADLHVGKDGTGTLTVENGGTVNAQTLCFATMKDLKGNGTINVKGLVSDIDLVFDATHGTNQALSFGTVGTLNLSLDGTGSLGAGYRGIASITVADGVEVASDSGYLGYNSGSSGTATVTGVGSTWTNSKILYVGYYGAGTLTVENGGLVSSDSGYVGYSGTGMLTVKNGGAANAQTLYVSYSSGTGTLTVENGGTVNANVLWAAVSDLKGNGTINVKGLVSDIDLVFDATHGTNQALPFGTVGTLNLSLDGTGSLGAGYRGIASITVADGIEIASDSGYLGYNSGSSGTATVTGSGSTWTNSDQFFLGYFGTGTLTIESGGKVSNKTGYLGCSSGSSGTATVTGAGSTWTNSYSLNVRYGTLTIENGGLVSSAYSFLGGNSGSTGIGVVTVTDAGSTWTSGELRVGSDGTGTMTVADGGLVSNTIGYLGYVSGSSGTATVTGAGSTWTNSSSLYVGHSGTSAGVLKVESGGKVSNTSGYLGRYSGSTGTATVTGAGSTWINSSSLYVGYSGTGSLTIADGGKVTAKSVSINNLSAVNLRVSGSGMLVVGDASTTGSVTNSGKVNLYADAFLDAGTYSPITEYHPGHTLTWSGTGTYNATGGTWNSTDHTFAVIVATALSAGAVDSVSTGERLLITDPASGGRVGASFGTVTAGTTFCASRMSESELSGLTLDAGESVLAAWDFTTNFTGGSALLAFDICLNASNLETWRYNGTSWSSYAAADLIYADNGIAGFTVSSFSGFAVTGKTIRGDTNRDGLANAVDIDAVYAHTGPGSNRWDINGDGTVNQTDVDELVSDILHTGYGDANLDRKVDLLDFQTLLDHWQLSAGWASANWNGDSKCDFLDFQTLIDYWNPEGYRGSSVPEPASAILLLSGAVALLRRRRRQ